MKKQVIILLSFGVILVSCGVTNHYTSSSYDDPIYYNAKEMHEVTLNPATSDKLIILQGETRNALNQSVKEDETEFIVTDVQDTTLSSDSEESYEDRLCKFDSPFYVINLTFTQGWGDAWDYPWYFNYYNPWYFRHFGYSPFYSPFYAPWYSPYYSSWYGPYYGMFGWWDPWYYGGLYGGYWGGYWGDPYWYHGGDNYNHHGGNNERAIIYGRRNDSNNGRPSGRNEINSGGSYLRRDANVTQVRGNDRFSNRSENVSTNRSQSLYRRDPATGVSGAVYNTDIVKSQNTSDRGSSYRRSTSSYRQPVTSTESSVGNSQPVYRRSTQTNNTERSNAPERSNVNTSRNTNENVSRTNSYSVPERSSTSGNSGNSGSSNSNSGNSGGGSVYRR